MATQNIPVLIESEAGVLTQLVKIGPIGPIKINRRLVFTSWRLELVRQLSPHNSDQVTKHKPKQ